MKQISPDIMEWSVQSVYTRVDECQIVRGRQFEHLHSILLLTLNVYLFLFEVS
jgi:hypothetical protein